MVLANPDDSRSPTPQFFSNSKPLKSWATLSFDRWTDHAVMSKFATMCVR